MEPIQSVAAVFKRSTGELVHLAPAHLLPAANDPILGISPLPSDFSEETWDWSKTTRTMVESTAKVEAVLIASIKVEAERRKMLVLSPGGAKKSEYAEQAAEVRFFWSLGGTVTAILGVIGLWSPERRAAVFPCATANAAEFGDTLDKAIGRFFAGMTSSSSKNAIAAREQRICAAIKAAATTSAKNAVAATATWP